MPPSAGVSLGAALDYLKSRFGGYLREVEGEVTVAAGAIPTMIVPADPERVMLGIFNLGATNLMLGFNNRVTFTRGIFLTQNGGFVGYSVDDDGLLPTSSFWCLSFGAADAIYWFGVRRETIIPGALP